MFYLGHFIWAHFIPAQRLPALCQLAAESQQPCGPATAPPQNPHRCQADRPSHARPAKSYRQGGRASAGSVEPGSREGTGGVAGIWPLDCRAGPGRGYVMGDACQQAGCSHHWWHGDYVSFTVRSSLLVIDTSVRHPEQGQTLGGTQWESQRESPGSNASAREKQRVTGGLVSHGSCP